MKKCTMQQEDMVLLARAGIEWFYPRRCPFCGEVIGKAELCQDCLPVCAELELTHKRLARQTHYFGELDGAAAVFHYQDVVRKAILLTKYQGYRCYAQDFGNIIAKVLFGCTFFRKYGILLPERTIAAGLEWDVIVPVPSSSKTRGYNVPYLMAQPLAKGLGLPIQKDALQRIRYEKAQAGLALDERLANVAGAFAPTRQCDVENRRVLLIDDVITTGATAAACTSALLAAGAQSVFAVALASSQWQDEMEDVG